MYRIVNDEELLLFVLLIDIYIYVRGGICWRIQEDLDFQ